MTGSRRAARGSCGFAALRGAQLVFSKPCSRRHFTPSESFPLLNRPMRSGTIFLGKCPSARGRLRQNSRRRLLSPWHHSVGRWLDLRLIDVGLLTPGLNSVRCRSIASMMIAKRGRARSAPCASPIDCRRRFRGCQRRCQVIRREHRDCATRIGGRPLHLNDEVTAAAKPQARRVSVAPASLEQPGHPLRPAPLSGEASLMK